MNTINATLVTYNLSELDPAIQEKIIERNRDINVDFDDWHDFVLDYWQDEKLPELGFVDATIHYTGFWNQGDGASFDATVDIIKFLRSHHLCNQFRTLFNAIQNGVYVEAVIRQSGHYYHEHTMSIDASFYYYPSDYTPDHAERLDYQSSYLEGLILDTAKDLARKIYQELQQAYEADISDEAVKDCLEANECQFLEDGSPAPVIWKHYKDGHSALAFVPGKTSERFNHVDMLV